MYCPAWERVTGEKEPTRSSNLLLAAVVSVNSLFGVKVHSLALAILLMLRYDDERLLSDAKLSLKTVV